MKDTQATILVVDDQESNIQTVGTLLLGCGYDVMPALGARVALQRIAARKPDLILMDMMMPEISGLDLCRRLKAKDQYADIPIIFLSAAGEVNLITAALEAGAVDYVTKPFHRAELLSRVRTHLALKAQADALRQLDADKEELLSLLAHDLKNRLAAIQLHAEFLSDEVNQLAVAQKQCVDVIISESTQMAAAIREMLANQGAARQPLQLQPVEAMGLLRELMDHFAPFAQQKAQALHILDTRSRELWVTADRAALRQVMENLISNAIKFSAKGSSIQLSANASASEGQLSVTDEGPGFAPEDHQRLFARYGRLSARPTGGESSTGLGLHIAYLLARRMGGGLQLESGGSGTGSTFVVNLALSGPPGINSLKEPEQP